MSNETKEALCGRCKCKFLFFVDEHKWRRYCDQCHPIVKAERSAAASQRLKASVAKLRSGEKTLGREIVVDVVRTHKEVAKIMGCTPEAVRQLEQRALIKARRLFAAMVDSLETV